jgi:hypothetical protein
MPVVAERLHAAVQGVGGVCCCQQDQRGRMLATARAQGSAASRKLTKHQARETLKRVAAGESSAQRAVRRRGLTGGVVRGWFFRRRLGADEYACRGSRNKRRGECTSRRRDQTDG